MALTDSEIQAAFNEEAGNAADLAAPGEIRRWFNEGLSRIGPTDGGSGLSWAAGDIEVSLPPDLVSISKIDFDTGVRAQDFRVFGRSLIVDRSGGATAAGTARIYYWAERSPLTDGGTFAGTDQEAYACLYFAQHRFWRKLSSNRVQYKRYATLLGQNAVSVSDLQNESDRLLQDFVDARADLPVLPPSGFYGG